MFRFWRQRDELREARKERERQVAGLRHTRIQTWLTLAGVMVALTAIVVPLLVVTNSGSNREVSFDDPSLTWRDRTWIVEGRAADLRSTDRLVVRAVDRDDGRTDTAAGVDDEGRYGARISGRDELVTIQIRASSTSGDRLGESRRLQVPERPDINRSSDVDVVVYNKVVAGPTTMREDDAPAYLTDSPDCIGRSDCGLSDTEFTTGHTLRAFCQTNGRQMTNRFGDVQNPENYDSTLWYGIELPDGRVGYLNEVWIVAEYRGGLNLPPCDSR